MDGLTPPNPEILNALNKLFAKAQRKKISINEIIPAVPGSGEIKGQSDLLAALEYLEAQGKIKLPSKKGRCWQPHGVLPLHLSLVRTQEAREQRARKTQLGRIREETPWTPKMAQFAPGLRTQAQLALAVPVNNYISNRGTTPVPIPHRERALEIFGNEKALDPYVHKGLFSGEITLEDLDCFYCPEPLPYDLFSLDPDTTRGRPLLLVENSATYWSCCTANRAEHPRGGGFFAAVVFGKGFKASSSTPIQSLDSLNKIEAQTRAQGVLYFGDLDPAGLAIAKRINENRLKNGYSGLRPALGLYRALLEKGLTTGYDKTQTHYHDALWVRQWLGKGLSATYLEGVNTRRWPQEGLTAEEIAESLDAERPGQNHT